MNLKKYTFVSLEGVNQYASVVLSQTDDTLVDDDDGAQLIIPPPPPRPARPGAVPYRMGKEV